MIYKTRPSLPIAATLVDVGGTLWSERWQSREGDDEVRIEQLLKAEPSFSHELCIEILEEIGRRTAKPDEPLTHTEARHIGDIMQQLGLQVDAERVLAIRKSMCLPALGRVEMLHGAPQLLAAIKGLGLRCVILSNAIWRDGDDYRRDFEVLGVGSYVDSIISSIDVGFRKPHRAMFDAALEKARCEPSQCVMIGNSELSDIEPANSLRMRTIRVAIEEPRPETSAAHAVAVSLHEVAAILRSWVM